MRLLMPRCFLVSSSFISPVDSCLGRAFRSPNSSEDRRSAGCLLVQSARCLRFGACSRSHLLAKATPAPFDPPRRLVIRGPYRFVRNPMYIGAGTALSGTALFYQSWSLLVFTGLFLLATHLFVISYEEPTLRRTFGKEYEAYCVQVNRWWIRSSPRNEAVR